MSRGFVDHNQHQFDESAQARLRRQDAALIYEITACGDCWGIPRQDLLGDDRITTAASMS